MANCIIKNALIDNVLCFISTSRDSLSNEEIIASTVAFYNGEAIKKAKETIFRLCNEKIIQRRQGDKNPNPSVPNVRDILLLFADREAEDFEFPTFLCNSFNGLPPVGFASVAETICNLRDEVAAFRVELQEHRKSRCSDIKAFEDLNDLRSDIADIKRTVNSSTKPSSSITPSTVQFPLLPVVPPLTAAQVVKKGLPSRRPSAVLPTAVGIKKTVVRNRGVVGTKQPSDVDRLSGVERELDVFVGRCSLDTEEKDISDYCSRNGVTVKKCQKITTISTSTVSFKVTVCASVRDSLLEADFWPQSIIVRKFYNRERNRQRRPSLNASTN